ncbi:unnamed protein product [Periconia digitata]|uniref:Heterokaryon incompatibility domain-containing protein n=1 Tax=Periconia digitata TaxID=1303443 RepID=A0A9W4XTW3_9PLEO|nr:unnamed protein product [Periconia digitata]
MKLITLYGPTQFAILLVFRHAEAEWRSHKAGQQPPKLEFFPDRPFPPYAILSHTWGPTGTEITFRDMEAGLEKTKPESYQKLNYTCLQAEEDGILYVWIDNFCIDKESSAELSESINSMYAWYNEAKICYAFMADVIADEDAQTSTEFSQSRWFTRGWTLQELIAPKEVIFYSKDWSQLGTRTTLATVISRITRIDQGILTRIHGLEHVSIAKRMSWASDRRTTRQEDMAYCLLGIFNISMPMLYGEGGEKAFRRLQEQIMQDSDDETLFAWTNPDAEQSELQGLLAKSPRDFRDSSTYLPDYDRSAVSPYSTTSRGLCITLGLVHFEDDIWVGSLDCPVPPTYDTNLAIYLKLLNKKSQQYARIRANRLCKVPHGAPRQTIYVRQKPLIPGFDDIYLHHALQLRNLKILHGSAGVEKSLEDSEYRFIDIFKNPLSSVVPPLPTSAPIGLPLKALELTRGPHQLTEAVILQRPDESYVAILLGSKPGLGIGVRVVGLPIQMSPVERPETVFDELVPYFAPLAPETWLDLGYDRYQVNIQAKVHAGIRYNMVDIVIKAPPSPMDILDVVPELSKMIHDNRKKSWRRMLP